MDRLSSDSSFKPLLKVLVRKYYGNPPAGGVICPEYAGYLAVSRGCGVTGIALELLGRPGSEIVDAERGRHHDGLSQEIIDPDFGVHGLVLQFQNERCHGD